MVNYYILQHNTTIRFKIVRYLYLYTKQTINIIYYYLFRHYYYSMLKIFLHHYVLISNLCEQITV